MRAVKFVLVETDSEYNNEVTLSNGLEIVVNTTIESVRNINREATIVSAPEGTILKKGDKVIVHHNIFRRKNNTEGVEIVSDYYIKDNIYFVPPTEVFAYKRDGIWKSLDPYVFVAPIKEEAKTTESGIYLSTGSKTTFLPNVGHIKYINEELKEWGLNEGDKVHFKDDSEYEFEIDGNLLYRMKTSDILGIY